VIYLDAAATVATNEETRSYMASIMETKWGSVSGAHSISRRAKNQLEEAREAFAKCVGVAPDNVVFTSGATESLNLIVQGYFRAHSDARLFVSSVEHDAVFQLALYLEKQGRDVTYLPVNNDGQLDLSALDNVHPDDLVCVMGVNNVIGTIYDVAVIAEKVHANGGRLLVDAVQCFYALHPRDVSTVADYAVFSGHKLGAPGGVGALTIKDRKTIENVSYGGKQEWELRPGSTPLYLCDTMVHVFQDVLEHRDAAITHLQHLQKICEQRIDAMDDATINGRDSKRSPHIVSINFHDIESQMLVVMADENGVCISRGSACASGASQPSHVLLALGMNEQETQSVVRLSFSPSTTVEEVEAGLDIIEHCVQKLRAS
jgi:cysteine desulfurase